MYCREIRERERKGREGVRVGEREREIEREKGRKRYLGSYLVD